VGFNQEAAFGLCWRFFAHSAADLRKLCDSELWPS